MPIEKHFDISFISSLALREKQIQQNYRPIIAVHKWFAGNAVSGADPLRIQ
jgi:putative DNA methylase